MHCNFCFNLPQVLGHAYHAIINYLQQKGLPSGPAFTAYYNMDMRTSMWRWVPRQKIPGQGRLSSVIPEGNKSLPL